MNDYCRRCNFLLLTDTERKNELCHFCQDDEKEKLEKLSTEQFRKLVDRLSNPRFKSLRGD